VCVCVCVCVCVRACVCVCVRAVEGMQEAGNTALYMSKQPAI